MDAGDDGLDEHFFFDVVAFFFATFERLCVVVTDAGILVGFLDVVFEMDYQLLEL